MGYVFLLPALILFMVVVAYPVFNTLKTSFYSIRVQNIATGGKWVGLANYKQLIQDPNTWVTLKFTLLFTVVSVILETVIGMGCALIMNIGTLCKSATVPAAVILCESAHYVTASADVGRRCEGEISQKTCRNKSTILLMSNTFGS